jgi:hypothetical protein
MATTVLDAVVSVLSSSQKPLSVREIHARVVEQGLFTFRTKDEVGIIRSAIRRHLRGAASGEGSKARLRAVGKDSFAAG